MFNNKHKYQLESPLGRWKVIHDPMGTEETEEENKRSEKTWGITVKIINNLQFIDEDKDWLLQNKAIYGANADVRLTVYTKNPYTDEYELDYTGFLDFTKVTEENNTLKIDFIEGGLRETFTDLKKEKVELSRTTDINDNPISELITDSLSLEGREIFLSSKLESDEETFVLHSGEWQSGGDLREGFYEAPLSVIANSDPDHISDPIHIIGAEQRSILGVGSMIYLLADMDKGKTEVSIDLTFRINGVGVRLASGTQMKVVLRRFLKIDPNNEIEYQDEQILVNVGDPRNNDLQTFTYNDTLELDIKEGESYGLFFVVDGSFGDAVNEGYITVNIDQYDALVVWNEDSFYPNTIAKCLTMFDVGQRLTEIYTGKPCFRSDLLSSGEWEHLLATCGFWIRNMKQETEDEGLKDRTMTYSFDDFFKDIYAIVPCAYSIETEGSQQFIRLEKIQDYFVPRVKIDLGKVSDYRKETAGDFIFGSLELGYTKGGNYEKPLGLDEPNVKTTWISPIRKQASKYEALGMGRADSYGVEQARRLQYEQHPDRDSQFDKDNFIIDGYLVTGRRGRVPAVYRVRTWEDDFAAAPKNIYSPDTAFNLRITPANNLRRHAFWFKTGLQLDAVPSGKLIYMNSDGNRELITQLLGESEVKENQSSIDIDDLNNRIAEADYISCKAPYSYELAQQLKGSSLINGKQVPHIYCLAELKNDKNETEKGFLISRKNKKNQPFEFKLLKAYGI